MYLKNRVEAGKKLAEKLNTYASKNIIVYGLPRGGVIVAYEVAKKLLAVLDVIIVRKIGHPNNPEFAIGAVSENGKFVGNIAELRNVDQEWLKREYGVQLKEARRRTKLYLGSENRFDVKGKTAILIDDGIATGLTMEAAITETRNRDPERIIVATPVAPAEVIKRLEKKVDGVVALIAPETYAIGISSYYEFFPQISDQEVVSLLKDSIRIQRDVSYGKTFSLN